MADRLDRLDIRLLACLQENNIQTADQLADQVGRSPSAIARRIRRLRASGVIAKDVAVISEQAAGFPLTAVVHVQFERHSASNIDQFNRRLAASPNVQVCLELAGPFDLLLIVVAANMEAFNEFASTMLTQSPVLRFETTVVKKRVKASLVVPLSSAL